jgi:Exocyst complex subunit SEC6
MQLKIQQLFLVATATKKSVYESSITKAFKPMLDIFEALLKGARPFIVVLTAVIVAIQLLKAFQDFQRGDGIQKSVTKVLGIIFVATLLLTCQSWLVPILKSVAGL